MEKTKISHPGDMSVRYVRFVRYAKPARPARQVQEVAYFVSGCTYFSEFDRCSIAVRVRVCVKVRVRVCVRLG